MLRLFQKLINKPDELDGDQKSDCYLEKNGMTIHLTHISERNVNDLKALNNSLFPIRYYDDYYNGLLANRNCTIMAYNGQQLIGSVSYSIHDFSPYHSNDLKKCYIRLIGSSPKYRRLGIATLLLERVISIVTECKYILSVFLHVQINNSGALEFYKANKFVVVEKVENYYDSIEPRHAYLLERKL